MQYEVLTDFARPRPHVFRFDFYYFVECWDIKHPVGHSSYPETFQNILFFLVEYLIQDLIFIFIFYVC